MRRKSQRIIRKVPRTLLYLSRADVVKTRLSIREVIEAVESAFQEKGAGKVEMPPKPGIHTRPNAFIHAMPAYLSSPEAAGMKWVSGYPQNQSKGLPYISGLLVLNDPETGFPQAVMDCTWITAKRTGAATAVAAKYLARKDSSAVGIVACGVQGRSNLEALCCLFPVQQVKAYDLHPEIAQRFAKEMGTKLKVKIETVKSVAEAVADLDIVVTSGPILKEPNPTIGAGWLAEGGFAGLLDFDSYWKSDAIREVDKLATDDIPQMSYYRKEGYFQEIPEPYADLGEIVAGKKPGRESDKEKTMAINLGLAVEDIVTAALIHDKAIKMGIGTKLPL
jgi:ornithine cyclodeaminase/alanine dehydrogenase-like protein (mu-crystallin family)